ncbi:MAG: hypothetical protein ABI134_14735, partial [Byssovorax sp.]
MKVGKTKWLPLALCMLAACSGPQQPPSAPLTADPPPSESSADPGSAETELDRGIAYFKSDKLDEARTHLEKSLQLKATGDAHYYLGVIKEKLHDGPGAEEAYKKALALDGKLTEAAINLGAL